MNWRRGIALLASVLALGSFISAAPALAETQTLAATCEVDIFTDGVAAPPIILDGSFRLGGTPAATVRVGEPIPVTGFQFWIQLDWDVLGPEMASRGVTELSGWLLGAWFRARNGDTEWPNPLGSEHARFGTFPVERLGTGLSSPPQDLELLHAVEPGTLELSNYGEVYIELHKLTSPQVTVIAQCTPVAGQDQRYGQVTVLP